MRHITLLLAFALASHAWQAAPGTGQEPKKQESSIEGSVVNSQTGEAVRRVALMLVRGGGSATITKAESDEKGRFFFQGLAPGTYQMIAERAGYARQAYGAKGNALSGIPLALQAGQQLKDLLFKLAPDAVISGRVLDEDNEPVPSAMVLALRATYQRGERQWAPLATAQANDIGEYRLAGLGAGRYVVAVTPRLAATSMLGVSGQALPAAPERDVVVTYYPNATDPGGAVPVQVAAGTEARGTDVRLAKVNTVRVRGKVNVPSDVRQLLVRLVPKGAGLIGMVTGKMTAVQGPSGAFELKGVAPGAYMLTAVSASGLLGDTGGFSVSMPLQVGEQHIDGLVLTPATAAELAGTVALEGQEAPRLGALQVLLAPRDFTNLGVPRSTVDDGGKFILKSVSTERYFVRVSDGPDGSYVKSVRLSNQEVSEEGLDFTNGVAGSLQITLSLAGAQVDGIVRGAEDKPVAGATVVLAPNSRRYSLFREARTAGDGAYSFKGVSPGDYKILAWEDIETGAYQDPEFLRKYESKAESLSLKESDRTTIQVKVIPAVL